MRVYEKYFARQIYLAFLFVLLAFVGLFVFFDLVSELGDVGRGGYRFQHALAYVLLFAPQRMYEIIPVASLIAAIYVCAQLAGNSEFTIFRVSGLSTGQALRSLLKIGLPVVLITFAIGEFVAPGAEQLAQKIRLEALGSSVSAGFRSGVWVKDTVDQDGGRVTRFINVGTLNPDNTIADVRIYEFDSALRLDSVRLAKLGQFQAPNYWQLTDVSETVFSATDDATASKDPLRALVQSKQVHIDKVQMKSELTPQILSVLMVSPDNMAIGSLYKYIGHLKENQQNTDRYNLALWQKLLYPFAVFVMMALALPFAYLHARAGAVGVKVFGGIMLGLSFHLSNTLFSHVGLLHTWPPIVSALVPGTLYLMIALGALRWVDRH